MARMELVSPPGRVRSRTDVTPRTQAAYVVRVRTVDWPERLDFIAEYDRLRNRAGLRDNEVAEQAIISHTSISSWRSGRQRPSFGALRKIAKPLRTTGRALAAVAGIDYLDEDDDAEVTVLPTEIEELLDNYGRMSETDQVDLLARVDWVNEWAESRLAKPETATRTRRRTG